MGSPNVSSAEPAPPTDARDRTRRIVPADAGMNGAGAGGGHPIDIDRLIDEAPLGALHLRVFLLCIAVGILDGIDTQSIGVAASAIAEELAIPTARFGPIFSAMLLGAALGAICFGSLADRIGRKRLLIVATVIFALATLLTARAEGFAQLLALRFVAGLGLGGATPCFLALGTEYAPLKWRRSTTAALWAGFPLGATLGGFLNAFLLAHFDWRALFYVGGTAPLVLALVLAALMPESLKYLVRRGAAPQRIARIARALDPGIAADARLVDRARASDRGQQGQSGAEAIPAAATAQLWTGFFLIFGILAVLVLWTPMLLHAEGMNPARAAGLIGLNGLGALLGTASAAPLIARFGLRAMTPALVLAALGIGAIAAAGIASLASSTSRRKP